SDRHVFDVREARPSWCSLRWVCLQSLGKRLDQGGHGGLSGGTEVDQAINRKSTHLNIRVLQRRDEQGHSGLRLPPRELVQLLQLRKLLEAAKPGVRDRNAPKGKTLQPTQAAERAGCPLQRRVIKAPTTNKRHICSAAGETDPAAHPFDFAYRALPRGRHP